MQFSGLITTPGDSTQWRATVSLGSEHIELECQEQRESCPWHEVQIAAAMGKQVRTLTFSDGRIFTPDDDQGFNQQLRQRRGQSWITRVEGSVRWIVVAIIVTSIAGWGIYRFGVPWLASELTPLVPNSVRVQISTQNIALMDKLRVLQPSALAQADQARLKALFDQEVAYLQAQGWRTGTVPTLLFRRLPSGPNAFAFPDGEVVLSDELVALLHDDDEIRAVLLHELGHVYLQHSIQLLLQQSIVGVSVAMILGDVSSIGNVISGAGTTLIQSSYSREKERQADHFAAVTLYYEHRSLEPMIQAFQKLMSVSDADADIPSWLSSHPGLQERIDTLKQLNH